MPGARPSRAVALAGERRHARLEQVATGEERPFVVMLDGVEDPYNFGQAIRAVYAAGAHGLVVRPRTWANAAGVVARASAGASERMTTAVADSGAEAIDHFRGRGLTVASTSRRAATAVHEAALSGPLFLLLGGERRGVTRSVIESVDLLLTIPYGREFPHSLGVAASASVIAFEVLRQRARAAHPPGPR